MGLVQKLTQPLEPPNYALLLDQFRRDAVAAELNVSTGYLSALLTGYRRPGPALEKKIMALVARIESEIQSA